MCLYEWSEVPSANSSSHIHMKVPVSLGPTASISGCQTGAAHCLNRAGRPQHCSTMSRASGDHRAGTRRECNASATNLYGDYTVVRCDGWIRGPRRLSVSRRSSPRSTRECALSRTKRKRTTAPGDQPGVEEDGGRPRAGGVAQHAADRRRQHGSDLADQVVHPERRAMVGGVGDVGDHRVGDRLHRVEERAVRRAGAARSHRRRPPPVMTMPKATVSAHCSEEIESRAQMQMLPRTHPREPRRLHRPGRARPAGPDPGRRGPSLPRAQEAPARGPRLPRSPTSTPRWSRSSPTRSGRSSSRTR